MSNILNHRIDFIAFASVDYANPNGDPLNGNRPRNTMDGFGEISDVCLKRKIRNRMQDMGSKIFVQSDDRSDDGCDSLLKRAKNAGFDKIKDENEFYKKACEIWTDVRAFGQVFAFSGLGCKSVGVRGPVSIHQAMSVAPVEIESMQITKSVSGEKKSESRGSDTMGMKHFVKHGLYKIKGSVNVQLAEKTGFTDDDALMLKNCLKSLFVNDLSSARPDGSMQIVKLYWFEHNCKEGQYSTKNVHESVNAKVKEGVVMPKSLDDYEWITTDLDGLKPEIINGL